MTAVRASRPGAGIGCVLGREVGVLVVLTDEGVQRASYGGRLLGQLARDHGCAPSPGDWVTLRRWHDGPLTVEAALGLRGPARPAEVVPLRKVRRHRA